MGRTLAKHCGHTSKKSVVYKQTQIGRKYMNILALESSTTSAKAMLYHTETGTFTVETKAYEFPAGTPIGKQDANIVFDTTMELGRKVSAGKQVDMIALVCTWHSVLLCDKNMQPATPLLQWTFTGASEICKKLREDEAYSLAYYQKTGCMVNATYPPFKLKLLREEGYRLEDYMVCDQGSYTMWRLTGNCVITDVTLSGGGMLNTHTRDYDDALNEELGIARENLPEIVPYNTSYPLTEQGAKLLGLQPGIQVIAAIADGASNHVGSGALAPGIMTFSMGTSAAMRLRADKPIIPDIPSTWCYVTPQSWLTGAATAGCTNCVDWCKEQLFGKNATYAQVEAGFGNLQEKPAVFLPFLFGERCPGWQDERMGGFYDLKPEHSAHDMYHAVLEGVLFNLYQCYQTLTDLVGTPHTIKLSGGIRHSAYWTQMCADIFQCPIELDPATQASTMGAVVIAMEKLGLIDDLLEMPFPKGEVIYPNAEHFARYQARFERYLYWYTQTATESAK